ncbi:uncharacterized protein BP5553_06080 [Venustampulla echinocandica]|uniref:Cytochrome P450 n=1 Tax=Venustampulla echinocandica TaxID=2656787 RepID=A0A370TMI2_9HELO|nr:uncharacterized protein BP5553_06080 [Venustampulla echinocandica]RDL36728.1 hypothetical protein BP5553_06080 [Venustampulla echinocandica]
MTNPEQLDDAADLTGKSRTLELDSLPYLRTVIDESLRMWRPTSTPLPRITPSDRTVSVAGTDNPPATRINAFQWFVHRDMTKWDRAHEWCLERWLGRRETDKKTVREDVLWAFGSGPRMCLGSNWT